MEINVLLSKALGLNTKNLISFQLSVNLHHIPVINAVYRIENFEKITAASKCFELHHIGVDKDIDLPDAGDGLKDDTTIEDTVTRCSSFF